MSTEKNNPVAFFLVNTSEVFYLDKDEITIGRSPANDFLAPDLRVSRGHAKINKLNDKFLLVDLNSSGGTHVNGKPIVQKLLEPGDVITLSQDFKMVFQQGADNLPADSRPYEPPQTTDPSTNTGTLTWPDDVSTDTSEPK